MSSANFFRRVIRAIQNSRLSKWCYERQELIILELDQAGYQQSAPVDGVLFNDLDAVDKFTPCESWHDKLSMQAEFKHRIDRNEVMAGWVEDDCLACYAWLNPKQSEAYFPLVRQNYIFPPNSGAIYNVYTHTGYRGRGLYKRVLNAVVERAFEHVGNEKIITAIEHDNHVALSVNRAMGFKPVYSLGYRCNFGRVQLDRYAI